MSRVREIVKENVGNSDKINKESDRRLISKNLVENQCLKDNDEYEEIKSIDDIEKFDASTSKEAYMQEEDTVALSYAWSGDEYQEKVIGFANYLRDNGYNAVMDVILKQE